MANQQSNNVGTATPNKGAAGSGSGGPASTDSAAAGNMSSDAFMAFLSKSRAAASGSASNGEQPNTSTGRRREESGQSEPAGDLTDDVSNESQARSSSAPHGQNSADGAAHGDNEDGNEELNFYGQPQTANQGDDGEDSSVDNQSPDESGDEDAGPAPKKGSAQARIRELVAQRKAAETALAQARAELARAQTGAGKDGAGQSQQTAVTSGLPQDHPRLAQIDAGLQQSRQWLALADQLKAKVEAGDSEPIKIKVKGATGEWEVQEYSPDDEPAMRQYHEQQISKLEIKRDLVAEEVGREHQAKLNAGRAQAREVYPWIAWAPAPGVPAGEAEKQAPAEWRIAKSIVDSLPKQVVQIMMNHPEGDLFMGRLAAGLAAERRALAAKKLNGTNATNGTNGNPAVRRNPPRVSVTAGAAPTERGKTEGRSQAIEERARQRGRMSGDEMIQVLRGRSGVARGE